MNNSYEFKISIENKLLCMRLQIFYLPTKIHLALTLTSFIQWKVTFPWLDFLLITHLDPGALGQSFFSSLPAPRWFSGMNSSHGIVLADVTLSYKKKKLSKLLRLIYFLIN